MTPDRVVARADLPAPAVRRRPGPSPSAPAPSPLAPGVSAVLDLQRAAGNGATANLLVPVQRQKKKAVGVAKYGSTKLTARLQDMMQRGVLGAAGAPASLDRDQLFLLQGVANVETGGMDNAVYTRDNMYVSLGFKQVTLGWDRSTRSWRRRPRPSPSTASSWAAAPTPSRRARARPSRARRTRSHSRRRRGPTGSSPRAP